MTDGAFSRIHIVLKTLYGGRIGAAAAGGALAAAATLAGVALLGLSGWFATAAALAGAGVASALAFDVFAPSAGVRFLALLRTAARYGERLTTHDATLGALSALRERLFRRYAAPDAARVLLFRPARLLFRLTADVDALDVLYLRVLVPLGAAAATAVAVGLGFGLIDGRLGAATAAFLASVGFAVPVVAALKARKPLRRRLYALEALRARTVDMTAGQTDLLTVGRLDAAKGAVVDAERRLAAADDRLNKIDVAVSFAFHGASAVLTAGATVAAAGLTHAGVVDAPVAALIVFAAVAALEPFAGLRRGALELGRSLFAAGRLAPALTPSPASSSPAPSSPAVPLAVPPAASPRPAPPAGFAVALDDATVERRDAGSGAGKRGGFVFHCPSLRLRIGERLALIGPSGSGKSTLMALLAGELTATRGDVRILDAAMLTQRVELFQDSLRDNLRLADPTAGDDALRRALAAAGSPDDAMRLPGGLDAKLGEGGAGLSAGQARRLALARLLLRDPAVWLLDEPTESLDGPTARDLLARLHARTAGRTVITATHTRREAATADMLAVVEQGRIGAVLMRGEPGFDAALAALRPD